MIHGFLKVASAIPETRVADCAFNAANILRTIRTAESLGVEIICFPELSITSYTCGDLFFQKLLLENAKNELTALTHSTAKLNIISIVGLPLMLDDKIFNVAAIFGRGTIYGFVPKTYLPNCGEYYEKRWFASANDTAKREIFFDTAIAAPTGQTITKTYYPFTPNLLLGNHRVKFAVEICEDLWAPNPPSTAHCIAGAHIMFNPSASNELVGKHEYRKALVGQQSARCMAAYVYSGSGCGESTTDIVFTGNAMIYENGSMLNEGKRFSFDGQTVIADIDVDRLKSLRMNSTSFNNHTNGIHINANIDFHETEMTVSRHVNPHPFVPSRKNANENLNEIISIQSGGLAKRIMHTGIQKQIIGVSGGLDSTLALLICANTCDRLHILRHNIIGVTMPGFGTSNRTLNNAIALMKELGVTIRKIDITDACRQHFDDIGHDGNTHDITYENTQARERTQILMDLANMYNGIVIGTGDLSELALGWTTFNGDHTSMYAVNVSIPKTLVRQLVEWFIDIQSTTAIKRILTDIINTAISPELLPVDEQHGTIQSTEAIIGPYELHDFFLYYMLRLGYTPSKIFFLAKTAFNNKYDQATILKWMKVFYQRFFTQQFKRSCLPDGPKVGSVNLSPRGDWRMPSDACYDLWMKELSELES
jgi:NAD+ synthase (glutamine-hydrolysing)